MGEFGDRFSKFSAAVSSQTGETEPYFVVFVHCRNVASLEIGAGSHLEDSRVPDYLILRLGKMLRSATQLQQPEDGYDAEVKTPNTTGPDMLKSKSRNGDKLSRKGGNIMEVEIGATRSEKLVPRKRLSYWSFDLLLLICSDPAKGMVSHDSDILPDKHNNTGSQVGDGSPRCAPPPPQSLQIYAGGVYCRRRTEGKPPLPKICTCTIG